MKTALITGSTKGIGREVGLDLLDKNYHVIFHYGHDDNEAKSLENYLENPEFPRIKGTYQIVKADLSYIEDLNKIKNKIPVLGLDVLILNAGITDRTSFGKITLENWNRVFNVNLTNQFFLIQDLKDKIRPNGKIIFISSISGIVPDAVSISYGVSKAAINMLVPYLAKEFADKKITVNAVAPGYTMTKWHQTKSHAQIQRISKKCLANRFGTPKEISKVIMMLIDNDFITSQIIRCDGGFGL